MGPAIAAAMAVALLGAPGASAAPGLETILQDDAQLLYHPEDQVRQSLGQLRDLGVDRIRVTASWSVLTRSPDATAKPAFDATDPAAYEQEKWAGLDRVVALAPEYGLSVLVDIGFWAPHWATTDAAGPRARTQIDPAAYADFATAVARRYSGSFRPPGVAGGSATPRDSSSDQGFLAALFGGSSQSSAPTAPLPAVTTGPLPRVDMFALWNEPNHPAFLAPQWQAVRPGVEVPASPTIYRHMVAASYPAIKAVRPDARVLVGNTAPSGGAGRRGEGAVPPLRFIRAMACVGPNLRPLTTPGCGDFQPIPGDGWAHHPYSLRTTPGVPSGPREPDDVRLGDLGKLVTLLDRLVAAGRMAPGLRDVYLTEYGYETDPPDRAGRFSTGQQASFLPWSEYLAWRTPQVKSFPQFLLRDLPPAATRQSDSARRAFGQWYSGLQFADGTPKLVTSAFAGGLFAERRKDDLLLWGLIRAGQGARRVEVQVRDAHGRWRGLKSAAQHGGRAEAGFVTSAEGVFERSAPPARPGGRRRYRVRWQLPDGWHASPPVPAVPAPR